MGRRRHAALVLRLGLAAWVAAACGTDAPTADLGGGCALASDCSSPLICAFQRCHQQCDSDRDCSAGARCLRSDGEGNVCQLPSEIDCERTSDCPAGQICAVDLQCRNACDGPKDCTPGEVCVDATCAKPDEIGPGGKLPQKGGDDGAPCRYTSECQAPRVCTHNECVYQCVSDKDCPIELRCVDNACEPLEPVCVPGQQRSCEPCGIKTCDDGGMWPLHCSHEGCGGAGNGGGGNGGGGSGPGSGTGGASSGTGMGGNGGASTTTAGPGSTTATSSSTGVGGATTTATTGATSTTGAAGASSSSGAATTTTGIGGATASSSTVVTTGSVGGSTASSSGVMSTGTSCTPCVDAGVIDGAGGDPHTRNLCCGP